MAHFALSDIDNQDYQAFERLSRSAAGLSGARATPFKVWLQDWSVEETGSNERGFSTYELYAAQDDIELRLTLDDLKGPILQGEQGFSRKGPEAGQASYYYSFTRLQTTGSVAIGGKRFNVQGYSWMDHEFSTSVLSEDQVGWDWFSIQMEDGSEVNGFPDSESRMAALIPSRAELSFLKMEQQHHFHSRILISSSRKVGKAHTQRPNTRRVGRLRYLYLS